LRIAPLHRTIESTVNLNRIIRPTVRMTPGGSVLGTTLEG